MRVLVFILFFRCVDFGPVIEFKLHVRDEPSSSSTRSFSGLRAGGICNAPVPLIMFIAG